MHRTATFTTSWRPAKLHSK